MSDSKIYIPPQVKAKLTEDEERTKGDDGDGEPIQNGGIEGGKDPVAIGPFS